jgi:hypothetical protein
MTSDSKKDSRRRSPEESLIELRRQYESAVERNDVNLIKQLKVIFERLGEQPRVSALSKSLKQHTKNRDR